MTQVLNHNALLLTKNSLITDDKIVYAILLFLQRILMLYNWIFLGNGQNQLETHTYLSNMT